MSERQVTMVRIYLHEAKSHLKELLSLLHDEKQVHGVTVFRGITGFGTSGKYHSSSPMDMSLDLPIVIEFYDDPDKVTAITRTLSECVKPGHMVWWPATISVE